MICIFKIKEDSRGECAYAEYVVKGADKVVKIIILKL